MTSQFLVRPSFPWLRTVLAAAACALLAACGGGAAPDVPAQAPMACVDLPDEITWLRSSAGSSDWNDVLVDRQNRIWLAGYVEGTIRQDRIDPGGNSRALVRQLSPQGRILWDSGSLLDTNGTDVAEALAIGPSGAVYIVGRTTGSLNGDASAGQFDTFVAWSEEGTAAWRTLLAGNERPQHPRRARVAPSGDLHIAGYDDEYIPSNYVAAWTDPFAVKVRRLDAGTGRERLSVQWQHQFDSEEPDLVEGLAVGADASVYVSGVVGTGARRGAFLRKLDPNGGVVWTVRYTSQSTDEIRAVSVLADGSLLVAGSVYGAFRGATAYGGQDIFVARVDPGDGHVIASWQYGSAGADWLTDMTVDDKGHIILFGETDGSMVAHQAPAGLADLFILRLSADGSVLARRQWGTADDERGQRVATDRCGGVVAVGSSTHAGVRAGVLWHWKP